MDPSTFVKFIFTGPRYFTECVQDSVNGIELKQNHSSNRGLIKKKSIYRKKRSCKNLALGKHNLERKEKGYFIWCF